MSYDSPRIKIEMSMMDMIMAMAGGNPGAINVLMAIIAKAKEIDPQDLLSPLGPIFTLDTNDIYESRIWQLYKDVAGQNLNVMLALLRANQLGFLDNNELTRAVDNYGEGIDVPALVQQVVERLPSFKIAA